MDGVFLGAHRSDRQKQKQLSYMETTNIKITDLQVNSGQVAGLPTNPRQIRDARFDLLKKSIQDAPEMLKLRELLVYPIDGGKYVIIGGNMRYRACKELGYKELPCKVLDAETPVEKLREYAIKDNESFGQYDWDLVANEWDADEITNWGVELPDIDIAEDAPEDLDGEDKNKPFVVKFTFESDEKLREFRDKYEKIIQDEFKVIISVSGGEL